jgi:hypothetical protein
VIQVPLNRDPVLYFFVFFFVYKIFVFVLLIVVRAEQLLTWNLYMKLMDGLAGPGSWHSWLLTVAL